MSASVDNIIKDNNKRYKKRLVLQMIKMPGVLIPLNECEASALNSLTNGEQYEIEIKRFRNPAFHRKMFAFLDFCFDHWAADKTEWQYFDERKQFETFRNNLTVLAGFKVVSYTIDGRMRVDAESLCYGNMEQDEFECCYSAMINAALRHLFNHTKDEQIINRLYGFF